jgi:hypothetical protein
MFEPDLRESDSALPYLNATGSDLESLVEDLESPPFTPNGVQFDSAWGRCSQQPIRWSFLQ